MTEGPTASTSQPTAAPGLPTASDEFLPVGNGGSLTPEEAARLLAGEGGIVVIIAGVAESGKTTLLSSIYDSFLDAPFAGYAFAGSSTLLGFDERAYMNRVTYGISKPDTERTSGSSPDPFLHLRLRKLAANARAVNLYLSDFAGEKFLELTNDSSAARKIPGLARADHFAVLVNGSDMLDNIRRHSAVTLARQVLSACVSEGVIGLKTSVQIVVTKHDLWRTDADATAFVSQKVTPTSLHIAGKVRDVRVFAIAARPDSDQVAFAYQVDEVLKCWLEPPAESLDPASDPTSLKAALRAIANGGPK